MRHALCFRYIYIYIRKHHTWRYIYLHMYITKTPRLLSVALHSESTKMILSTSNAFGEAVYVVFNELWLFNIRYGTASWSWSHSLIQIHFGQIYDKWKTDRLNLWPNQQQDYKKFVFYVSCIPVKRWCEGMACLNFRQSIVNVYCAEYISKKIVKLVVVYCTPI